MGDHGAHTAGGHQARNVLCRGQARRQWLLDEEGLAGPARRLHDSRVKHRRHCHDYGVDARVGHQATLVIVKAAAIGRRELLPSIRLRRPDGDEGCVRQVLPM
jgi:hypothetical protein